jgi:uncharacterized protein (DUF934 family)
MRFINPELDPWQLHAAAPAAAAAPTRPTLFDLDSWRAVRATWPQGHPAGVWLPNDADVESVERELPGLALIALQFPKWTDGRAYSQARLLRARLRYAGELRATGEVLVDMLPLLQRTGFDAVLLRLDQSLDSAQRALRFFAGHYQGDVQPSPPRFQRQAA